MLLFQEQVIQLKVFLQDEAISHVKILRNNNLFITWFGLSSKIINFL